MRFKRSKTSRKIAELHREGIPHKQAIAIGLNEERAGTTRLHGPKVSKEIKYWVGLGFTPKEAYHLTMQDIYGGKGRKR